MNDGSYECAFIYREGAASRKENAMTNHSCTIHPDVVDDVAKRMVRGETLDKMSAFLKVVADPTRLSIVSALLIREMCVCDLAKLLDMEHSAVSHQLAVLRRNDVVKVRAEGKVKYYSLSDEHINTVFSVTFMHVNE